MKRRKSKVTGSDQTPVPGREAAPPEEANGEHVTLTTMDELPNETLIIIFSKLAFPSKQYAAIVCRRWHDLLQEAPFCHVLAPDSCLSAELRNAAPGDTLICPPGLYQETLLVDRPLRLVSANYWHSQRNRMTACRHQPHHNLQHYPHHPHPQPGQHHPQQQHQQKPKSTNHHDTPQHPQSQQGAQSGRRTAAASCGFLTRGSFLTPPPAEMTAVGDGEGPGGKQPQQHPQQGSGPVPEPLLLWAQRLLQPQHRRGNKGQGSRGGQQGEGGESRRAGVYLGRTTGEVVRGAGGGARGAVAPTVAVLVQRPPVVVMNARCCFVGFEFHTATEQHETSICCFGPLAYVARFEHCTFSGHTGLRVPYSKGSHTRLELYDCTLMGTTQSLAAVQMDAGQLLAVRCVVQNNSVGVEVGPDSLARLVDCKVQWCGTAMVVDGCLAASGCRVWGNTKLGNVSTDARVRTALALSDVLLSGAGAGGSNPQPLNHPQQHPQQQLAPSAAAAAPPASASRRAPANGAPQRRSGAGSGAGSAPSAAAGAGGSGGGGGSGSLSNAGSHSGVGSPHLPWASAAAPSSTVAAPGPGLPANPAAAVAALAAAQWRDVASAFACRQQLVRLVGCEVEGPQPGPVVGLHKEVRKQARQLVRQVYGEPDNDAYPEWEVLVHSDLDSEEDEEDESASVVSGSGSGSSGEMDSGGSSSSMSISSGSSSDSGGDDEEGDAVLDLADDTDLDESGGLSSSIENISSSSSDDSNSSSDDSSSSDSENNDSHKPSSSSSSDSSDSDRDDDSD